MTEHSQTYWNTLIEQYRDGSIDAEDRYTLEKRALDDPFLFDALEGFSLHSEAQKSKKGAARIFTLPRIAVAASLIVLVGVMVVMNGEKDQAAMNDQSIAMVLDNEPKGDKDLLIIEESEEESAESTPESTSRNLEQKVENSRNSNASEAAPSSIKARREQAPSLKKNKEVAHTLSKPSSTDVSGAIEASARQETPQEVEDVVSEELNEEAQLQLMKENPNQKVEVAGLGLAQTKESPLQKSKNSFLPDSASDSRDLQESVASPDRKTPKGYYEAVPVIGKAIFDDYAKERIDESGLRKNKPQEVTIEFTINKNGMLTDFHHIFTGCSECGSFAISILQKSGEWKTVPPGFAGKARYVFMF